MTDEEYIRSLEGIDLRQSEIDELLEIVGRLKAENAELKAQLAKAVVLPEPFIEQDDYSKKYCVYISKIETSCDTVRDMYDTEEQARARIEKLKRKAKK